MNAAPLVLLGPYGAAYAALALRLRRRGRALSPLRAAAFALGLAAVAAGTVLRVDTTSLLAHVTTHELLLNVAPVLLLLGIDARLAAPLTRVVGHAVAARPGRLRALGALASPVLALALYVVAQAAWHVPAVYDAAARSAVLHPLEHVLLLWTGLLFWFHLLRPLPSVRRLAPPAQLAYLLAGTLAGGLVAAVLAGAPRALYPGVADLAAQRLAGGAMMAVEMPLALGVATAVLMRAAARR